MIELTDEVVDPNDYFTPDLRKRLIAWIDKNHKIKSSDQNLDEWFVELCQDYWTNGNPTASVEISQHDSISKCTVVFTCDVLDIYDEDEDPFLTIFS